jgi:hypothetical protein
MHDPGLGSGRLPQHVHQFLEEHIDSVEQLEALILLSEEPGRFWTATEVSERLRTSRGSVLIRLAALVDRGLLQPRGDTFVYLVTGTPDPRVRDVAACFKSHRLAVIQAIFTTGRGSS